MAVKDHIRHLEKLSLATDIFRMALCKCQTDSPELFSRVRHDLSLTQPDMALRLGIHATYLSKLERGREVPGADLLIRLYEAATKR